MDKQSYDSILNIRKILMIAIICLIFISSFGNTIFARQAVLKGNYNLYKLMYIGSLYIIVLLATTLFFVSLSFSSTIHISIFGLLCFFIYEVVYTFLMGILDIKDIVLCNLCWMLVFISSYCYSKTTRNDDSILSKIAVIGTVIYIGLNVRNIQLHTTNMDLHGAVIGTVYYCFGFLAMIWLFSSKKLSNLFSVIVGVFILFSTKRAGLLIIIIGFLAYYYLQLKNNEEYSNISKTSMIMVLLLLGFYLGGYYVIQRFQINIMGRFSSLITDEGSGRGTIWRLVLSSFKQFDLPHRLFGCGFHAVPILLHPTGRYIYAHCGFLEVLYDYGYLGMMIMIAGILMIVLPTLRMIKNKFAFAPIMAFCIVTIIFLCLVSYLFEESRYVLPLAVVCGYILGKYRQDLEYYNNEIDEYV